MYTAVIRRMTGGSGLKVSKKVGGDLFITDTRAANVQTFFEAWPRHLTTYLCYGRSTRAELTHTSSARGQFRIPCRGYVNLALRDEDAEAVAALARLSGSGGGLLTYPKNESVEPAPKPLPKVTLHKIRLKHERAQPISMVTAYDYPSARLADNAGVDVLLVGDSLGMVVLGREDTTDVTMDEMVHHCRAAARGTSRAFLLGDLPFGSCLTPVDAARNGVRLIKEGRVDAVKLEGGERMVPQVRALVDAGVAVCGHIGLTPQSYAQLGGYRIQGKSSEAACSLLREAKALEKAGVFALVLEMVPSPVAAEITAQLRIPVIGIGAGSATSGQVQVFHDLLGLYDKHAPKFSKRFGDFEEGMTEAIRAYAQAVDTRAFPQPTHSFAMADGELRKFRQAVRAGAGHGPLDPVPTVCTMAATNDGSATIGGAIGSGTPAGQAAACLASSNGPTVVATIAEWRRLQAAGVVPARGLGLVPTMGALHAGHLSLLSLARRDNDATAASVFVNPRQFAAHEDLGSYPRPWEADLEALAKHGVDFVFAPAPDEMYPPSRPPRLAPFVDLADVDVGTAEGAARPGFFRGVATVVSKLLNIVGPRAVYFGQKDGMQCVVVRRLIEDLNFDVELVVGPTIREPDGLAMSSRNVYLSPVERAAAPAVYAALLAVSAKYDAGERSAEALHSAATRVIERERLMSLDYLSLASAIDGRELAPDAPLGVGGEPTLASIAVKLGTTRLIDNVVLE